MTVRTTPGHINSINVVESRLGVWSLSSPGNTGNRTYCMRVRRGTIAGLVVGYPLGLSSSLLAFGERLFCGRWVMRPTRAGTGGLEGTHVPFRFGIRVDVPQGHDTGMSWELLLQRSSVRLGKLKLRTLRQHPIGISDARPYFFSKHWPGSLSRLSRYS
jgi:hypothetical protein